jgi:capsular polysaccharide biosynthesis protein
MNAPTDSPPASSSSRVLGPREKRIWPLIFVICTTVAALAAAGIYLSVRKSSYDSTVNILVAPLATDDPNFQGVPLIRESSDGTRPVQTAAGLVGTPAAARLTATGLGPQWTETKVENAVQVQPRGESDIVAVIAEAESPSEAARIANRYAAAALHLRRQSIEPELEHEIQVLSGQPDSSERIRRLRAAQVHGDPTLAIASRAQPPTSQSSPSSKLIVLVAVIVGLLVGIGGVLVMDVAKRPMPAIPPRN